MAILNSIFLKHIRRGMDVVFPINCIECGILIDTSENNGVFCSDCRVVEPDHAAIQCPTCNGWLPDRSLIMDDGCYCCLKTGKSLSGIITLGKYHDDQKLGEMILSMKHGGKTWFSREFGSQLAQRISTRFPGQSWHAAVGVPLHFTRRWKRGYNQAALIAGFLADSLNIPCYDWLLSRIRRTPSQFGGRLERRDNIENAFLAGGTCQNANIILVDDVVTTGATVRESADVLFKAGAASVLVAACAWVPMGRINLQERQKKFGD
ncbi:ComF family protein [bacterium]|nr:ComF family protein [bacterium]